MKTILSAFELEDYWFEVIKNNDIPEIKSLIKQGIDVNLQDQYYDTALIHAANAGNAKLVNILLRHPKIDITITGFNEVTFMEVSEFPDKRSISPIINYSLQNKIKENNREDILFFFEKENLLHPKFKKENTTLFVANNWGLIV